MLKLRVITAIILASLIVSAVIYLPTQLLALVFAVIICVAAWEWAACAGFNALPHKVIYVAGILICLMLCLFLMPRPGLILIIASGLVWWLIAIYLVIQYQSHENVRFSSSLFKAILGAVILVPSWLSLVLIHAQDSGVTQILFLFLLIWLADSAAYFSGRKFGKRKLAVSVSPGKSWEGVYGALFMSFLFACAYVVYVDMQWPYAVFFIVLAMATVSFSILGDLVESMFKRMASIKDSSNILPGHGGVLDRIDSLTSAAPIFFTGLWVMERAA